MNWNYWTPEETELARQMLLDRESPEAFVLKTGHTKQAARDRINRTRHNQELKTGLGIRGTSAIIKVAPDVMQEAWSRNSAPRTLTAWLMGDPAPGRSAGDRREASR